MKIHHVLAQVLATKVGKLLPYQEIQALVQAAYPHVKASSILPAEHIGKKSSKSCLLCQQQPLFERQGHGLYKVLPLVETPLEKSSHEKL